MRTLANRYLAGIAGVLLLLAASWAWATHDTTATPADAPFNKRRLIVQPRDTNGNIVVVPFQQDPVLWLRGQQQNYYKSISRALRGVSGAHSAQAGLTLGLLSFLYGVLHAAGPGHGKAVISTWLLATENQLRRGILVAFLSSIVQALSAIVLVCGLLLIFDTAGAAAKNSAKFLEIASFCLIGLAGVYLFWTGLKRLPAKSKRSSVAIEPAAPRFEIVNPLPVGHVHGPGCGCDHVHLPTARDVEGDWSFAKACWLAFAVGIRPCSGSILLLVFANTLGMLWVGVLSTLAMSFGTFLTVACIAALAVYSKKIAMSLFADNTNTLDWVITCLRLVGGVLITVLGGFLIVGALSGQGGNF